MIFVSHRESERQVGQLLVEFLLSAIEIEDKSIRCTSVPGHQLSYGQTISSQLKTDLHASSAIFAILTPQSLGSKWVLFELGASWALGKIVVPILGPGLRVSELPGPLVEYPCVRVDALDCTARLRDSVNQVALQLGLRERTGGKVQDKLDAFISGFRAWRAPSDPTVRQATAFRLSWLLLNFITPNATHPFAIREQIEVYALTLGLKLGESWAEDVHRDDTGASLMAVTERLGGQIAAREPQLLPYFEAAFNLLIDASRTGGTKFDTIVWNLALPEPLRNQQGTIFERVNLIHEHFYSVLRLAG
jgi:hypothetical protein